MYLDVLPWSANTQISLSGTLSKEIASWWSLAAALGCLLPVAGPSHSSTGQQLVNPEGRSALGFGYICVTLDDSRGSNCTEGHSGLARTFLFYVCPICFHSFSFLCILTVLGPAPNHFGTCLQENLNWSGWYWKWSEKLGSEKGSGAWLIHYRIICALVYDRS